MGENIPFKPVMRLNKKQGDRYPVACFYLYAYPKEDTALKLVRLLENYFE